MKAAYVDASCLVAIAFGEAGAAGARGSILAYDELFSSNLLEAELRSALSREKVTADPGELLSAISWVYPDRPLTAEISQILDAGYVRGAGLWHLAVALFVDPTCEIDFLSLDVQQSEVSRRVGFGKR
jgi:PIN domain nuclease of toxin-antitoxin system